MPQTRASTALQTCTAIKSEPPEQLFSPPSTPATRKRGIPVDINARSKTSKSSEATRIEPATPISGRKRARTTAKAEDSGGKGKPGVKKLKIIASAAAAAAAAADPYAPKATKAGNKAKVNGYGLTPGHSPYPDYPHPTPAECQEVNRQLAAVHGQVEAPSEVPVPSLTVTGCGEVPSVLDALIRTRLSAATTGSNSSRAFQGLVKRFGVIQDGVGKGSVDWDAVRVADTNDVFEAIKTGGLADVKSKDIKKILQMVHEEQQARHDTRAEAGVLSLDHLHALPSSDDIMSHLLRYPGIGVKTASCVLLFCFQRPSFAVDTHVFRLVSWLHWVPPDRCVTRDSAYAHLDVRIPDELKYALHTLLIRHGKTCPRCRASTGIAGDGWAKGCPIDHLVQRTGARKCVEAAAATAPNRKRRPKKGS